MRINIIVNGLQFYLFIGNTLHKRRKKGYEINSTSRFSNEDVAEMRRMKEAGKGLRKIAKHFACSHEQVNLLLKGRVKALSKITKKRNGKE